MVFGAAWGVGGEGRGGEVEGRQRVRRGGNLGESFREKQSLRERRGWGGRVWGVATGGGGSKDESERRRGLGGLGG